MRPRSAASSPGSVNSRSIVASTSAGARPGSKPNETDESSGSIVTVGVIRRPRKTPSASSRAR